MQNIESAVRMVRRERGEVKGSEVLGLCSDSDEEPGVVTSAFARHVSFTSIDVHFDPVASW